MSDRRRTRGLRAQLPHARPPHRTGVLLAVLALTGAPLAGAAQDDTPEPREQERPAEAVRIDLPPDTTFEAAALWARMTAALRDPEARDQRIEGFEIRFDLRARQGVQTNDLRIDASFLAPDYVRFNDPKGRRVGIGPDGPWLVGQDDAVVRLEGREYRQDRRNLARIRNLARNYLALADPEGIRVDSLRLLDGVPPGLPKIKKVRPRRLDWLELVTPDFGVVSAPPREVEEREDSAPVPPPGTTPKPTPPGAPPAEGAGESNEAAPEEPRFRVFIGCEAETARPLLVVIRSAELLPPDRLIEHCIHLREFRPDRRSRGVQLPWALDVYERWPAVPSYTAYPEVSSQEIVLIRASLDVSDVSPDDFRAPE